MVWYGYGYNSEQLAFPISINKTIARKNSFFDLLTRMARSYIYVHYFETKIIINLLYIYILLIKIYSEIFKNHQQIFSTINHDTNQFLSLLISLKICPWFLLLNLSIKSLLFILLNKQNFAFPLMLTPFLHHH